MTLLELLSQTPWSSVFRDRLALDRFADQAGFAAGELRAGRIFRRHPDGLILHHAAADDGGTIVAVIARPESLEIDGDADPFGIVHESPIERARRDLAVAYENVCAVISLLQINLREERDAPDLGRRGAACGHLDLAAIHLGQNLDAARREALKAAGSAKGTALRPPPRMTED